MKKIVWLMVILWIITGLNVSLRCQQTAHQNHKHQNHEHDEAQKKKQDRDRWLWQLPQRVMNVIGVKPGMVIGDVGAGEGYFTFRLAERVGESGKIYANDIDEMSLNIIEKSIRDDGIKNIITIRGKPDDPLLPEGRLDIVIMVNVFHLLEKPVNFLQNLKPGLKKGGTLVLVQWDSVKMKIEHPDMSAKDSQIYSKEYLLERVKTAGYDVLRIETFLPVQNIYICRPTK